MSLPVRVQYGRPAYHRGIACRSTLSDQRSRNVRLAEADAVGQQRAVTTSQQLLDALKRVSLERCQ
jgi:hypothetical protein